VNFALGGDDDLFLSHQSNLPRERAADGRGDGVAVRVIGRFAQAGTSRAAAKAGAPRGVSNDLF
jgi:hypothetical protein